MTSAVILGMIVTMFPEPREQARAIGARLRTGRETALEHRHARPVAAVGVLDLLEAIDRDAGGDRFVRVAGLKYGG